MAKKPFKLTVSQKKAAKKWLELSSCNATRFCPTVFLLGWNCECCKGLFPSIKYTPGCSCNTLTYKYVREVVLKAVK